MNSTFLDALLVNLWEKISFYSNRLNFFDLFDVIIHTNKCMGETAGFKLISKIYPRYDISDNIADA